MPCSIWCSIISDVLLKSDWVANFTFLGVLFLEDFYEEFYFSMHLSIFIYAYYGNVLLYLVRKVLLIKEE